MSGKTNANPFGSKKLADPKNPFGKKEEEPKPAAAAVVNKSPFGAAAKQPPASAAGGRPSPFGKKDDPPKASPFGGAKKEDKPPAEKASPFAGSTAPKPSPFGAKAATSESSMRPATAPQGGRSTATVSTAKATNSSIGATKRIMPGVSCFAWNKDGSMCAVCPTTPELWIYKTNSSPDLTKWTKIKTLKEHFNVITSLDWHPDTNLLLSASADRGVIVWDQSKDYLPQMGMIKESRANLDASWNHRGDKFIVGASSGNIYLGRYFPDNNFWVAHPVTKKPKHAASVVCARFDPLAGRVVASCSLDGTC